MGIGLVGTTADFAPWSWVNPLYRRLLIRENSQNRDPIGEVRLGVSVRYALIPGSDVSMTRVC